MWEFKLSRAVRIMCKKLSFFLSFSCPFHICNYIYQYVNCSSHHSPILISCFEEATIITLNQSKQTNESHMSPSERASVKKRLLQFMHRMDVRQLKWDNSEWSQASTEPWTTTKLLFPVSANMFNMSSGNWIRNLCKPLTSGFPTLPKYKEWGGKVPISCTGTRLCPAPAQSLSEPQCLRKNQQQMVQTQGWAWI